METFEEPFKIKTITRSVNLKGISLTIVTNNLYLQNLYNLDTCLISQQTTHLPFAAATPKLWHSSTESSTWTTLLTTTRNSNTPMNSLIVIYQLNSRSLTSTLGFEYHTGLLKWSLGYFTPFSLELNFEQDLTLTQTLQITSQIRNVLDTWICQHTYKT